MKKCPNCGASLNPYMVRCEYCRSWIFDWDVLLKDGEKCFINFVFDNGNGEKITLTSLAIPHIKAIVPKTDIVDISDIYGCKRNVIVSSSYEIHTVFSCTEGPEFRKECKNG